MLTRRATYPATSAATKELFAPIHGTARIISTTFVALEAGYQRGMATDVEIERALATVTATLNDHRLEEFDADQVQEMVTASLGGQPVLRVDDAGGLHEEGGRRVGAVRWTDRRAWNAEPQH